MRILNQFIFFLEIRVARGCHQLTSLSVFKVGYKVIIGIGKLFQYRCVAIGASPSIENNAVIRYVAL